MQNKNIPICVDINSLFVEKCAENVSLDSTFKKSNVPLTRYVNLMIKNEDILEQFNINAIIHMGTELTKNIDVLLEKTFSLQRQVSAILNKTSSKQLKINTVLKKTNEQTQKNIDALITLRNEKTFDADVDFQESYSETFDVDVKLAETGYRSFLLDAFLFQTEALCKDVNCYFSKMFDTSRYVSSLLKKIGETETFDVDSIIGTLLSKQFLLDFMLQKAQQSLTRNIDSTLKKVDASTTFLIDNILQKTVSKQFAVDCLMETPFI